jgi:aldose 1-epimerase
MKLSLCAITSLALTFAVTGVFAAPPMMPINIDKQPFGTTRDGQEVFLYTLNNTAGMEVKITNYGGTIQSIRVPDRDKNFADVVLGFDSVAGYQQPKNTSYFGALIGRYANRLANGQFQLHGKQYHIPTNDGPNTLHGGLKGFDKRVWDATPMETADGPALQLRYLSKDGEEGFPGNLNVTVTYTLDKKNGLHIDYQATTDQETVLNITNHSYFNLSGAGNPSILKDRLTIDADNYTPVDSTLIPTGKIEPVSGTPLDFRHGNVIGDRINKDDEQLKLGKGYDHNFVLNHPGDLKVVAAKVEDPASGRVLEVYTDQPGLQFYTGNFLDGSVSGGIGGQYIYRSALCLETQHFPDTPNHANFPTAVLEPGQKFHQITIFRFKTEQ